MHPEYYLGVPVNWVDQWQVDYYNGRACDKDGKPQARDHWYQYKEGDFKGVAIDPNDPPQYESEASFLKRHNLFYPGEERRLTSEDFEPEIIGEEDEN